MSQEYLGRIYESFSREKTHRWIPSRDRTWHDDRKEPRGHDGWRYRCRKVHLGEKEAVLK